MIVRLFALALLAVVAVLIAKSVPDIARYLPHTGDVRVSRPHNGSPRHPPGLGLVFDLLRYLRIRKM